MATEKSTPNTPAVGAGLNAARHGRSDAEVRRESLCSAFMRKQRCMEQLVQRASCTSGCAGQSWLHSQLHSCLLEEFLDTSEEEEVLGRPASEAMRDESLQWAMMVFTAIDENDDQIISENELRKAHALIAAYGNGMADLAHGGQMEGIDTNHNGEVDKDEL